MLATPGLPFLWRAQPIMRKRMMVMMIMKMVVVVMIMMVMMMMMTMMMMIFLEPSANPERGTLPPCQSRALLTSPSSFFSLSAEPSTKMANQG